MSWGTAWLAWRLRHRVVHRLPGRLRVQLPVLREVDSTYRQIIDALVGELDKPGGIQRIQLSYLTGSALIDYEVGTVAEREVLDWLFVLRNSVADILTRLAPLDTDQRARAANRLLTFLREAAQRGTKVDASFGIPESVWKQEEAAASL